MAGKKFSMWVFCQFCCSIGALQEKHMLYLLNVAVPPHLLNSANRMAIGREHGARGPVPTTQGMSLLIYSFIIKLVSA